MTERARNIAVGATAVVALCGLGYMILLFGDTPVFARTGYYVTIDLPGTGALDKGADVRMNGIRVGTVTKVNLNDDPRKGVVIRCRIRKDVRIPHDVVATVGRQGLGGGGYVRLTTKAPAEPVAPVWVPTDGSGVLTGSPHGGGLLGPEFAAQVEAVAEGFRAFTELADTLNKALTAPDADDEQPMPGLAGTIQRMNRALEGLNSIVADKANRENISVSLANLRKAAESGAEAMDELAQFAREAKQSLKGVERTTGELTETAKTARARIDDVAAKLIEDADRLGKLLTTLNQAATKVADGEGTAGRLLNDPALYNNLLESTESLSKALAEMELTIRRWRTEGLKMRFK